MNNSTTVIADVIFDYFTKGIRIGADVLSFACSTLSAVSPDELSTLLLDPLEYGEGLIDLVFSPDAKVQLDIEPLIPSGGVPIDDQKDIFASLAARLATVRIYYFYPDQYMEKKLTAAPLLMFIKKLHLEKNLHYLPIPYDEIQLIRNNYISARVLIRSKNFPITKKREIFIDKLVYILAVKKRIEEQYILRCIDFALKIFRDFVDDIDVNLIISEKIRINRGIIERKNYFKEYNRTHSMEYLMSQKIYDPPGNMDAILEDVLVAEIINYAVFGIDEETYLSQSQPLELLVEKLKQLYLHKP